MKKLYLTYCSARKRLGVHPPEKLYMSGRIIRFINRCRDLNVDWAIFSALYGFVFPEEEKEDYNVTFRTDKNYWLEIALVQDQRKLSYVQSKEHILQLTRQMKRQSNELGVNQVIFYGPSPKMMKCYLGVLHYAFDGCSQSHGWRDLLEHIKGPSETIKVVHRLVELH